MSEPEIGATVAYRLTAKDVSEIDKRNVARGADIAAGQSFPMTVLAVNPGSVVYGAVNLPGKGRWTVLAKVGVGPGTCS